MLAILVSGRLWQAGAGLDLTALGVRLQNAMPDARVRVVADLARAGEVARAATECEADRLVLATAGARDRGAGLQAEARSAGIDPLGVVVLDLAADAALLCDRAVAMERAMLLLAGAAAKARAFGGSRAEHVRPQVSLTMDRRAFLRMSAPDQRAVPSTPVQCAAASGCRSCVDACPAEAVRWYGQRMHIDKARCTSCGICATACPSGSIEFPGWSEDEIDAQLTALADREVAELAPRGALFACRSNAVAMRRAIGRGARYPTGWLPVVVPCVGMLSAAALLRPLTLGIDAVGVAPCGTTCGSDQRQVAVERIGFCRDLLAALGEERERILLCPMDGAAWPDPPARAPMAIASATRPGAVPAQRAAETVLALARAHTAAEDVELLDARSPLAMVEVDASCSGCMSCVDACPTGALASEPHDGAVVLTFDPTRCGGCALCAPRCPEGAIRIRPAVDVRALATGPAVVFRDATPRCQRCGEAIAPAAMLRRVAALLGEEGAALAPTLVRYCSSCRVLAGQDERPVDVRAEEVPHVRG